MKKANDSSLTLDEWKKIYAIVDKHNDGRIDPSEDDCVELATLIHESFSSIDQYIDVDGGFTEDEADIILEFSETYLDEFSFVERAGIVYRVHADGTVYRVDGIRLIPQKEEKPKKESLGEFRFNYKDSSGKITEDREAKFFKTKEKGGKFYFSAFCFSSERPRDFRVDRVTNLRNIDTGESIDDAVSFAKRLQK